MLVFLSLCDLVDVKVNITYERISQIIYRNPKPPPKKAIAITLCLSIHPMRFELMVNIANAIV